MTSTQFTDNVMSITLANSEVKQAVHSFTMSKRYIITALKASVTNILYHRLNIDEKEFVSKSFNKVPFKSHRSKSKNLYIREFHAYMAACKDALEKNYLQEFHLYLVDKNSGDIKENYKFSFKYYRSKDERPQVQSDELIESTYELLRTLEGLGKFEKINCEIEVKVEFTYFDDVSQEYEPPGFENIFESDSLEKKLSNKTSDFFLIGNLFTGFHRLKCRGRGEVYNFNNALSKASVTELQEDKNNEKEYNSNNALSKASVTELQEDKNNEKEYNSNNALSKASVTELQEDRNNEKEYNSNALSKASLTELQDRNNENDSMQVVINHELYTEDVTPQDEVPNTATSHAGLSRENVNDNTINDSYISDFIELSSDEEVQMNNCSCKMFHIEDYNLDRVKCVLCKESYHTPCQGYLDQTYVPVPFQCYHCNKENDSIINNVESTLQHKFRKCRYLLGIIYKYKKVPDSFKKQYTDCLKIIRDFNIFAFVRNELKIINPDSLKIFFSFEYRALPEV